MRIGSHKDLAKFKSVLKDARSDGKVTHSERKDIAKAFSKLEKGEKKAAKNMLKGKAKKKLKDGHKDAKRLKNTVKNALKDGKIGPKERQLIKKQFANLEPGEQQRTIDNLAQSGHQRLAIALAQSR